MAKTPFSAYMQKNIFEKAGMKKSYVRERVSPNTARYFMPTFYDTIYRHVDSLINRKIYTDYSLGGTYGDNNIVTSMQELLLFDKALNSGKLLPPELVKTMYQPAKLANGEYFFNGGRKPIRLAGM